MEASKPQINFSQQQIQQYLLCPESAYVGGHVGGTKSCVYCAQIYRRYRRLQKQVISQTVKPAEPREEEEQDEVQGTKNFKQKIAGEESVECNKIMCMRAGWCMCE